MPQAQHVSAGRLASYGIGTLILVGLLTWMLAELATPDGVKVVTADNLTDLGRTIGLIAAAAVGVPAAVLAYHRQRALDTANQTAASQHKHKVDADNREHHTGTERHLRERYTTCAEQLGHGNSAIRVAGVYALASLADDWHEFGNDSERQVCIDLLCAYLRGSSQPPAGDPAELDDDKARPSREEDQVRATIIRIIQSRTEHEQWVNCEFDLRGANLTGADLARADLSGALLVHSDLTGANLTGANLTRASVFHANLTIAFLSGADLSGAELPFVKLIGANLIGADLTRANVIGADLTRADLTRAKLSGAHLPGANLTGANLTGADLTGASLGSGCRYSAATKWPEGFTPPPRLPDVPEQEP